MNRHAMYLRSIDGGEETNDLIRGKGTTRKIIEGIHLLRDHSLGMRNGFPKIVVNYCVDEHNPGDIDRVTPIAREVVRSSLITISAGSCLRRKGTSTTAFWRPIRRQTHERLDRLGHHEQLREDQRRD